MPVVSMASFATSLLEPSIHEIADEFADFAGHAPGLWNDDRRGCIGVPSFVSSSKTKVVPPIR